MFSPLVAIAAENISFSDHDRQGVIISTVLGSLSVVSVTCLLAHIFVVTVIPFIRHRKDSARNEERVFLRIQLGVFVVCLLTSDLVQALGVLIQAKWASDGGITQGSVCNAQGFLIQFGDNATAVWNAVVAFQTFYTVVLGRRLAGWTVTMIVVAGWALALVINLAGPFMVATPDRGPFYGVAGLWCFVTESYAKERIIFHYGPMLVSAGIILILYVMVFLSLRGNLEATGREWTFHWSIHGRDAKKDILGVTSTVIVGPESGHMPVAQLRALAMKMLYYPICYLTLVLPIATMRLIGIQDRQALLTGMCLLFLMGTVNTVIYCTTRRLGPSPFSCGSRENKNLPAHGVSPYYPPRSVQVQIDQVIHDDNDGSIKGTPFDEDFPHPLSPDLKRALDFHSGPPHRVVSLRVSRDHPRTTSKSHSSKTSQGSFKGTRRTRPSLDESYDMPHVSTQPKEVDVVDALGDMEAGSAPHSPRLWEPIRDTEKDGEWSHGF